MPRRKSRLSQKQIAEKLGISSATVSLVLRDPDTNRASAHTKERIFACVSDQGGGAHPVNSRADTVLFVLRGGERRFFFQQSMLHGAQEQAAALGLKLEVVNARQDFHLLGSASHVRGVLLDSPGVALAWPGDTRPQLRRVTLNGWFHVPTPGITVNADPFDGFRQAIEYLRDQGHPRIGFMGFHNTAEYTDPRSSERVLAFEASYRNLGMTVTDETIRLVPSNVSETIDRSAEIAAILEAWRDSPSGPTAVICYNDLLAAKAMVVGLNLGIRVPEHLSLIGYDNESLCSMLSPNLTSICPQFFRMGSVAVSLLVNDCVWDDGGGVSKVIVPSRLMVRQSVASYAGD